ncbi:iron-dependent peroxidase [Flexivirga endophytica]|uniref:Iron-dependent peroxidase n=1 Tax=Flexivirga endophytica TaxID=1849103 RepID=A0A916TCK8_9MICO|nr:Dyp-type peroxidase [Flexivirga endophytica]GGB40181.1 iron-dependent peroxidase [Flexivirga endophytica]GHB48028.1 iron-dependent peroxidase [Flexivirga endophytica]
MTQPNRRTLLRAGVVTGGAGAIAVAATAGRALADTSAPHAAGRRRLAAFHGRHQSGVLGDPLPAATIVAFDLATSTRPDLEELLRTLTTTLRALTTGGVAADPGITTTAGTGLLGPDGPTHALESVVALGHRVFTDTFGLAGAKPRRLRAMDTFPNDQLDPAWCGGDVLITLQAHDRDVVTNALREVCRATRGSMQIRWKQDGFTSAPRPTGHPRNLLGFKDGIAGPDPRDDKQMGSLVWADGGEPAWAAGGSYYVMRRIRMLVEFWDRVSTSEQERMFGRRKDTGAPLTGGGEGSTPDYGNDPNGSAIPLDSHIRMANPRTPATAASQFLRRSYSYDAGVDSVGNLDMGLMFGAFNADLDRQFVAVQKRLADEPLVDYITPVGGGYFFALPGVRNTKDFYGSTLLA